MKAERTGAIKVMDLNFLYTALISMVSKYRDLMRLAGNETDYFVKIVLINSWRFIPFLDDEDYMRQIGTHGIPMMMQDIVLAPPGNKAGTFFKITEPELQRKEDQGNTKEQSVSAIQALRIAELIFESMGIDVWFDDKGEGERSFIDIKSLFTASERATRNQKVVNQLNRGSS